MGIFALQVKYSRSLSSKPLPKELNAELLCVLPQVSGIKLLWIPRHAAPEINRELHGFQVTDIEDPQLVHSIVVCQLHLLPHPLYLTYINPLAIAWRSHIVHMIIKSVSALMSVCKRSLSVASVKLWQYSDISPVVITKE